MEGEVLLVEDGGEFIIMQRWREKLKLLGDGWRSFIYWKMAAEVLIIGRWRSHNYWMMVGEVSSLGIFNTREERPNILKEISKDTITEGVVFSS
jgi:hypothetical protein